MKNLGISDDLIDALLETANIGTGKAASSLSELTGRAVEITVPELVIFDASEPLKLSELQEVAVIRVAQNFWTNPEGHALLLLNQAGSLRLAKLILGDEIEAESFGETEQSALLELGNIMINGLIGSISNQLNLKLSYGVPYLDIKGISNFDELVLDFLPANTGRIVFMRASLKISAETVHGHIVLIFDEKNLSLTLSLMEALL